MHFPNRFYFIRKKAFGFYVCLSFQYLDTIPVKNNFVFRHYTFVMHFRVPTQNTISTEFFFLRKFCFGCNFSNRFFMSVINSILKFFGTSICYAQLSLSLSENWHIVIKVECLYKTLENLGKYCILNECILWNLMWKVAYYLATAHLPTLIIKNAFDLFRCQERATTSYF